ncbi:MAG: hypothetical protein M5R36_19125 [Deltaproteobacteria bacterium]|nr:hypothetical protein [Deltaproteobacteria bacterium]
MKGYQKRRIIYVSGVVLALFFIGSLLLDAGWVFRVFLFMNDRKIELDTNYDDRPDYFELWEGGALVLSEWDTNFDGLVDYRNRFQHGEREPYLLEVDADYDEYFEYRERLDVKSGVITCEIDEDGDGTFEPKACSPVSGKNTPES